MAHTYTQAEVLQNINELAAQIVAENLAAPGVSTEDRLNGVVLNLFELFDGVYGDGFPLCILATNPDPETNAASLAAGADVYPVAALDYGVDCGGLLSAAWLEGLS